MFLDKIQNNEIPIIKKENVNSIKKPTENPTSVKLTESSNTKNFIGKNNAVLNQNANDCSVQLPCYKVGELIECRNPIPYR
jgi:hypothetical protein